MTFSFGLSLSLSCSLYSISWGSHIKFEYFLRLLPWYQAPYIWVISWAHVYQNQEIDPDLWSTLFDPENAFFNPKNAFFEPENAFFVPENALFDPENAMERFWIPFLMLLKFTLLMLKIARLISLLVNLFMLRLLRQLIKDLRFPIWHSISPSYSGTAIRWMLMVPFFSS